MMTKPAPVPGETHPAYADLNLPDDDRDHYNVLIPPATTVGEWRADDAPVTVEPMPHHTLTRQKAAFRFDHRFGYWLWPVWTDELGRHAVPKSAQWVPRGSEDWWNPPFDTKEWFATMVIAGRLTFDQFAERFCMGHEDHYEVGGHRGKTYDTDTGTYCWGAKKEAEGVLGVGRRLLAASAHDQLYDF